MFVRLLAVLIYDVLCYFSVLVYCRSLVQIGDQNDEIKQKWKLVPCKCDRAHCARTQGARSSADTWTRVSRIALADPCSIASTLAPWEF